MSFKQGLDYVPNLFSYNVLLSFKTTDIDKLLNLDVIDYLKGLYIIRVYFIILNKITV